MRDVVRRPSRLQALAALQANAESSAEGLDRITRIACRALGVPVALVNLIGSDRQRFLGCGSVPEPWASMRDMPLEAGWCPFALETDAFAFSDARKDPELAANPAARELGVVSYAGVPLRSADGEPIGTLCAVDYEPHDWTGEEPALMTDLAGSAVAELQLLGASRLLARDHARLHALETASSALAGARSPDEVLHTVMGAVERPEAAALWTGAGDDVRPTAATGTCADALARSEAPIAARVARAGRPVFLGSRDEVREAFGLEGIGSMALLPVTAVGRSVGVLATCFPDERRFGDDDRDYLAALAGMSGLALAHA